MSSSKRNAENATAPAPKRRKQADQQQRNDSLVHPVVRQNCSRHLMELLNQHSEYGEQLEKCVYDLYTGDRMLYQRKLHQLCYNLAKNGEFLIKQYPADVLAVLPDSMLAEHTDVAQRKVLQERKMSKFNLMLNDFDNQLETEVANVKQIFKCRQCGSGNISTYQRQTRSADEASKTWFICQNCATRWTQG